MPSLAIHGGAGVFPAELFPAALRKQYEDALLAGLAAGWTVLDGGGSSVDAVEASICSMEDCPLFNAGHGAVLNELGGVECDAAIMDGATGKAGALATFACVKNPISLARRILDQDRFLFLSGEGALRFARAQGMELVPESYFVTSHRLAELEEAKTSNIVALDHAKFGTVGAVARDAKGNLAAGTSTGGLTNKAVGRIGDSVVIGAGTYADNSSCAISCTGVGEIFIRKVVGHEISARMRFAGESLEQAVRHVVYNDLAPIGGTGGLVAVDSSGQVCADFNSNSMYRAWQMDGSGPHAAIFR